MKSKQSIFALFILAVLLLSACKVNFITDIKSDGSGSYTQELGFTKDEAAMAGLSSGGAGEEFCKNANTQGGGSELPPGTTIRQETRNGDETWCIFETSFKSLNDLKSVYATTDLQINNLSLADGKLVYDVTLDMSGESGSAPMADIYWLVTLPGKIGDHNATEVDGNTLKWKLLIGQKNNLHAESAVGGFNFDFGGDWIWYVLGGGALLCLCCIVPLVIAALAFFLIRRKKQSETVALKPSAETPAS
jgi:hypothetical protein